MSYRTVSFVFLGFPVRRPTKTATVDHVSIPITTHLLGQSSAELVLVVNSIHWHTDPLDRSPQE
jgi:hypothetical protein